MSGVSVLRDGKYTAKILANDVISRLLPQSDPIDAKLKSIHSRSLGEFQTRISNIRSIRLKKDFRLECFFQRFHNYFFRRLFGKQIAVEWAEGRLHHAPSGWTTWQRDTRGHQSVLIRIVKPTKKYWSETNIQDVLSTLLIEMVNAAFLLHTYTCPSCSRIRQEVPKAKLITALEEEANSSLTGFPRPWRLRNAEAGDSA